MLKENRVNDSNQEIHGKDDRANNYSEQQECPDNAGDLFTKEKDPITEVELNAVLLFIFNLFFVSAMNGGVVLLIHATVELIGLAFSFHGLNYILKQCPTFRAGSSTERIGIFIPMGGRS